MSKKAVTVRLVFADGGSYHTEEVTLPAASVDGYDRLIDCFREDPKVLKKIYVDVERLVAAYRVDA